MNIEIEKKTFTKLKIKDKFIYAPSGCHPHIECEVVYVTKGRNHIKAKVITKKDWRHGQVFNFYPNGNFVKFEMVGTKLENLTFENKQGKTFQTEIKKVS